MMRNLIKIVYRWTRRLVGFCIHPIILWDIRTTASIILTYIADNRKLKAIPSVKRGFENHLSEVPAANAEYMNIFPRLINAYTKAKADQENVDQPYRVGIKWQREIDMSCVQLVDTIRDKDTGKLQALLENFHREHISLGLQGNAEWANMNKPLYKYLFVNTWYKFYNLYEELAGSQPKLTYPMVGNPAGLYHEGQVIPFHAIRFHYSATEMLSLLADTNHPVICEIGSGLGGQAHAVLSNSRRAITYILLDIPEVLIVASYFLMAALPEKRFLLYEEGRLDANKLNQYDVILMPNFALPRLGDETVDMFFNNSSFSEMDSETVKEYLRQIERICKRYLMHINHNTKFTWHEDEKETFNIPSTQVIPDPKQFKKIYQHPWLLNTIPEELYYMGTGFLAFLYERRHPVL